MDHRLNDNCDVTSFGKLSVVSLRDCVSTDLDDLITYWTPAVRRWLPGTLNGGESTRAFLAQAISSAETTPRTNFVLIAEVEGRFIGTGRTTVRDFANASGDIGYALRGDAWGRGYGTQIASQLVEIGFNQLQLHRIWATAHPENAASVRVLEKAGLSYEGRLRDHCRMEEGWRDSLLFAVIDPERTDTVDSEEST